MTSKRTLNQSTRRRGKASDPVSSAEMASIPSRAMSRWANTSAEKRPSLIARLQNQHHRRHHDPALLLLAGAGLELLGDGLVLGGEGDGGGLGVHGGSPAACVA